MLSIVTSDRVCDEGRTSRVSSYVSDGDTTTLTRVDRDR
jgi:hypothetical protein